MEENKTTTVEDSKLSYEQLEQVASMLQQKVAQTEAKLKTINVAMLRLECLFRVLDKAQYFSKEFVANCTDEIVDLLKVDKEETPTEETKE